MKVTRDIVMRLLAVLALAAATVWIVFNTEWVEVSEATPARGEAENDQLYALKQMLRRLGVTVASPINFDKLPPPNATLVLGSLHWSLFPGRGEPLRRWVEAGGHLVVDDMALNDEQLSTWIPIKLAAPTRIASAPAPARARPTPSERRERCPTLDEPSNRPGAYGTPRGFRVCGSGVRVLEATAPVLWSLMGAQGMEYVRVAVGRGEVTAGTGYGLNTNREIFRADHALATVAVLQAAPGREIWFVTSEKRPPLLALIWQLGAPAVLLCGLAVALAVWRGAVRFGPAAPVPPLARRSMADQIRGTARFIWRRNGAALYQAQLRALDETAAARLPSYDTMDANSRAAAIARASALDAASLARAMDASPPRRRDLPAVLALLESARRRLVGITPKS